MSNTHLMMTKGCNASEPSCDSRSMIRLFDAMLATASQMQRRRTRFTQNTERASLHERASDLRARTILDSPVQTSRPR